MTVYVPPAVITDPAILRANAISLMEAELPGWKPIAGSPEMVIIDAYSFSAAEQAEVLVGQLTGAYRGIGPLIGTPPIEAQPATSLATVTAVDTAGHTIKAGTLIVGVRNANGELEGFQLGTDLVIAPGSATGAATLVAEERGPGGNSLSGVAELIASPPSVKSVTLGTSGGGIEAESEEAYLTRLTEAFALQRPGPVRAEDAAAMARTIPGVYRATAVNLLKPAVADGGEGAEETNVEKCVTVACTDGNGLGSNAEVLAEVLKLLVSLREPNFKFFAVKPHYTKVDVTATVYAWPGQTLETVKAEVVAALERFLSPQRWGPDSSLNPRRWANDPKVRQSELFTAVAGVPGVRWCSALTFGKHGGALATTDVTLGEGSAVPALPESTGATFTITVEPST